MPLPPESPAAERLSACPIIDPVLLTPAPRLAPLVDGDDARRALGEARAAYGALADRYDELAREAKARPR